MTMSSEQKAEMDAIKTILDKQKAGTTLTSDEQAKLDAFEASHPKMNGKKYGNNASDEDDKGDNEITIKIV